MTSTTTHKVNRTNGVDILAVLSSTAKYINDQTDREVDIQAHALDLNRLKEQK